MRRATTRQTPANIAELGRKVAHWRETRTRRGRMPEELWATAVSLTASHSVFKVAQGATVDFLTLKRRVESGAASSAVLAGKRASDEAVEFVEIGLAPMFGVGERGETVVEMSKVDGARMTMRIPGAQAVDVVGLATSFWRHA